MPGPACLRRRPQPDFDNRLMAFRGYSDDYIGQKFITYVDTLFISGTHDGGTRMISRNALPRLGKTTSSCFYVTANGRRVADRHRTNLPLISPDGSTVNHLFHHFTHMK